MEKQKIKNIRNRLGWTQSELAEYFNVSRSAVNNWEMGLRSPNELHEAVLAELGKRLDKFESEQKKQEFLNKFTNYAVSGGLIAFILWLFVESKNDKND